MFSSYSIYFYFFYGLSFLYILISMGLYFLQYGFQSFDEVIHIFFGQYQWREDTENVGAAATGKAMLFVDELTANFLVRNVEAGAYHQTTPITSVRSSVQKVWLSPFSYPLPSHFLAKAEAAIFCCFSVMLVSEEGRTKSEEFISNSCVVSSCWQR